MDTPIVLIIFNRPDTTEKVFAEIAKAKPTKLFIVADGPRTNQPDDVEQCHAARAVVDRVDWDCKVLKNYSDVNLGCGLRPATGISWVFENVEEAIILEDDCVPGQTFFQYCEELLERFHDDERVMTISGMNIDYGQEKWPYSYSFHLLPHTWGWATWRRAWQYFDFEVKLWPELRDSSWLLDIAENPGAVEYYKSRFDLASNSGGNIDYWDYQWKFACWSQRGYSISPNKNLIRNIGFGEHATHTKSKKYHQKFANFSVEEMDFPLKHPPFLVVDRAAHLLRFKVRFPEEEKRLSWYHRLYRKFYTVMAILWFLIFDNLMLLFSRKEKRKDYGDKLNTSVQYKYAKIKNRRYFCLQQRPAVLAWVLFIRKETLSPGFKLDSKKKLRWIYWWYRYNYNFFRTNFRILIGFIQYKILLRNIESDLELPFYGQLSMLVHKGYKIFDIRRGIVRKVFNQGVDSSTISAEITRLKKVSKIDFAPTIRKWSIKDGWYEEDYIRGSLESGTQPDSDKLLNRFYRDIIPCLEKVMSFQLPVEKKIIEYVNDIRQSLNLTNLPGNEQDLSKTKKVMDFIDLIANQLQNENSCSVYLLFTHGDFCPENMLKTDNGLHIFDWESAAYRSALFDFYSYFFYRPVQHDIAVDKIIIEINAALPFLMSGISLKAHNVSNSLLPLEKTYRWLFYLERISMLVEREKTDKNLDIMNYILRYIDVFNCYEEKVNDNLSVLN